MSNQEPPFEQPEEVPQPQQQPGEQPSPEQPPAEERGINPDPREQPRSDVAAPQMPPPGYPPQGYPPQEGYPPSQGYPPPQQGYIPQQGYPPPQQGYYAGPAVAPRRRRNPWLGCFIAFIIILFLCSGLAVVGTLLGFGLGIAGSLRNSVTEPTHTFQVGASPALILTSGAGSVTINSGSTNRIIVQAKKYASFGGNLNNVQINYSQSGNTVNVAAQSSGTLNFFNATSVDFTITVPPTTNLQINTNDGSITVNSISGKMSLESNAGSIGVTQASLSSSSTCKTNAGSINFTGNISSPGTYDFETNAGSIDMTLSRTDSFHVNASTDAGSINTNFPVTVNRSTAGATMNGDVGISPQVTLTLKTNAGSINLNKG